MNHHPCPELCVVAVDPGVTSGVAVVSFHSDGTTEQHLSVEVDVGSVYTTLKNLITEYPNASVVAEAFLITSRTGKLNAPGTSLEIIGALRAILMDSGRGWFALSLQRPSDAKALVSNQMLSSIGLWHRGGGGHAMDALRHAALYAVKHRWMPYE
jgi:hypothetical protein